MKLKLTCHHAWIVAGSGLFLALAALVVGYRLDIYGYSGKIVAWYRPLIELMPILGALVVGGIIAARMPQNVYGWIWLLLGWGAGVLQAWGSLLAALALSASASPAHSTLGTIAVLVAGVGWLLSFPMISLALLYYPNGHLPSPRWRWVVISMFIAQGVAALLMWAIPGPSGIAPVDNPLGQPGVFGQTAETIAIAAIGYIFFLVYPLAVLSLFARYRQVGNLERAQLRWFLFMAAVNVIFLVLDSTEIHHPWISEDTMTILSSLLLTGLPIAVAVAVLRYRLYDIDILIRRTLQYTLLTGLLALVYFGVVIILQGILGPLTGRANAPMATVVSTLVIAALFNPLRSRVQIFIDRRFYRQKYDAGKMLAKFAATTRDEVDMEKLAAALLSVVEEAMQPESMHVWVRNTQREVSTAGGNPQKSP
jgi:hypothetical protein